MNKEFPISTGGIGQQRINRVFCSGIDYIQVIFQEIIHGAVEYVAYFKEGFKRRNPLTMLELTYINDGDISELGQLLLCKRPLLPDNADSVSD